MSLSSVPSLLIVGFPFIFPSILVSTFVSKFCLSPCMFFNLFNFFSLSLLFKNHKCMDFYKGTSRAGFIHHFTPTISALPIGIWTTTHRGTLYIHTWVPSKSGHVTLWYLQGSFSHFWGGSNLVLLPEGCGPQMTDIYLAYFLLSRKGKTKSRRLQAQGK